MLATRVRLTGLGPILALCRRSVLPMLAALVLLWTAAGAVHGSNFVGDLVYCDVDANGIFDGADVPLDGVTVTVSCTNSSGDVCVDATTTTGTLHPTAIHDLHLFNTVCADDATFNPEDPDDLAGRYLVEVSQGCFVSAFSMPYTCTVTVDPSSLTADCNALVTPREEGFPVDGNNDGDHCDAEDGPFPEGQPLGNIPSQGGCEAFPDPPPTDGVYTAIVYNAYPFQERCSLQHDFGYTGAPNGATRTPGFWKNHPEAVAMFVPFEFCGETVDETCQAVALLGTNGGGLNAFTRHAAAASLNCTAFGCPPAVAALIADGSAACANGDPFDFGSASSLLDLFNNSGDDLPLGFEPGSADPKFCKAGKGPKKPK